MAAPSSSKMPVAPVVLNDALPPLQGGVNDEYPWQSPDSQFRQEHYERIQQSGAHISGPLAERWPMRPEQMPQTPTEYAREMEYDAACRATRGGLLDAPDDGGPQAVGSKPFRF